MTSLPLQDNRYHRARATADRDRRIPIEPATEAVTPLGNPWEVPFDARPQPRWIHWLKSVAGLALLIALFWAGVHIA